MPLIKPRFVAFDSSQLGNWSKDRNSPDPTRHEPVRTFEACLVATNTVPVISRHHLNELIGVTKSLALERLDFLASLPIVAWVKAYGTSGLPGDVTDILTLEIEATLLHDNAEAVRNHVAGRIFDVAPGARPVSLLRQNIDVFQALFAEEAESQRQQVAITRAEVTQAPKVTLRELAAMGFKSPQAVTKTISEMTPKLAGEVKDRGDSRIQRPADEVAARFFHRVLHSAPAAGADIMGTLRRHLAAMEVDIDELGPDAKFSELMALGVFRQQLKVVSQNLPSVAWSKIRARATENRMPSALVEKGLRLYGQDQPERKGSEITDRYLATLACYADLTFVDKRTQSDIGRIKREIPSLQGLMRQTEKVTVWDKVVEHLNGGGLLNP